MCADRPSDDFVQVNVSPDDETTSSSLPPQIYQLAPQIEEESSSNRLQNPLAVDEVTSQHEEDDDDDDSTFEDETIVERLIGLTEMFPEWLRDGFTTVVSKSASAVKNTYSFSRGAVWFIASTATICLFPLLLEVERAQMEEQEATEHRSMMLGPGGVGGTPGVAGFQANLPILSPVSTK